MKSLVGNIGTLALVAMAGFAVAACSSSIDTSSPSGSSAKSDENVGSIGLQLQPVLGVNVTSVHYIVTAGNPALTPAPAIISEGNLPTPGTGSNFSFGIPLKVGSGYYISLSGVDATSPDTIKCTGASGPFSVLSNQSTLFNMTLTCTDVTNGQIIAVVDVKTDACPRLIVDYAVAEPSTANVGSSIAVRAMAHDLDNAAEVITYAWSIVDPTLGSKGQFLPATAANTDFKCLSGADALRIKITATNHQCSKALETVVSCKNVACGNGLVDAGETCDPAASAAGVLPVHAADPTCPADCTKVCGDGNAEGNETCDPLPLNPSVCLPPGSVGECTPRVQLCNDGFVTAPEVCDGTIGVPAGSSCAANCLSLVGPAPVKCGDGVTAAPETCDDGTGTNAAPVAVATRTCGDTCSVLSTAACVTCEQAGDCFASSDNCNGTAAAPFTAAQRAACYAVTQCIRDTNCLDGAGTLGKCYCGTLSTASCGAAPFDLTAAGAPNGPCAALMQAGNAGLTTNSAILGGLTNKSRPAGAAGQRLNCDKTDTACAPLCGVQ